MRDSRTTNDSSRRNVLRSSVAIGLAALAGCLGNSGILDREADDENPVTAGPPTVDRSLPQEYTIEELNEATVSGGPDQDGIPSIDEPQFASADEPPANLDGGDPVFGVELNGDAKAYPQYTLVWHEIVNDVVGGESVAVTYCPLTGTAQGFYRGESELGVSGRLINSNLVMFDRGTETW